MRMKNIAVMLVLGCLATSAMAGKYTVVGDLTVESNATLNTVAVQNGIVIEGDTLLQNSRLGMRNSSSNDFAFVSNVGTGDVSVLNIADAMFVGESSNVVIGTVQTNGEEKLQVVGNVKADYFIGDGSLLTNVSVGSAVYASARGDRTAATLSSIFTEMELSGETGEVVIDSGVWNIDSDVTVPENVTLNIRPGSMLEIASGRSVTLNGNVVDGMQQMFSAKHYTFSVWPAASELEGVGGSVVGLDFARPEWFGAKADDEIADGDALNTALESANTLLLSGGEYLLDKTLTPRTGKTIQGAGMDSTTLKASPDLSGFGITYKPGNGGHNIAPMRSAKPATYDHSLGVWTADSTVLQDVCIDGNFDEIQRAGYTNISVNCLGIWGEGNLVFRCKFVGWGGAKGGSECMAVYVGDPKIGSTKPNIVDSCIYTDMGSLEYMSPSAMGLNGGGDCSYPTNQPTAHQWTTYRVKTDAIKIIRNCIVKNVKGVFWDINGSGWVAAMGIGAFSGANVVENNMIVGCEGVAGYGNDTTPINPLIIRNNRFWDVTVGVTLVHNQWGGVYRNVLIENNSISTVTISRGAPAGGLSFLVSHDPTLGEVFPVVSNMVIRGNTICLSGNTNYFDTVYDRSIWFYDKLLGSNSLPGAALQPWYNVQIYDNLISGYIVNSIGIDTNTGYQINQDNFNFSGNQRFDGVTVRPRWNGVSEFNYEQTTFRQPAISADYSAFLNSTVNDLTVNNSATLNTLVVQNGLVADSLSVSGGTMNFSGLPTSTNGLVSGDLWNDGGFLKIMP